VLDPNDPNDPEDGPAFTLTIDGEPRQAGVMLDAQWRWVHTAEFGSCDGSQNASANERCIVQGLSSDDYAGNYGISAVDDSVTLKCAFFPTPRLVVRSFQQPPFLLAACRITTTPRLSPCVRVACAALAFARFATMSPYGSAPCYGSRAFITDRAAGGYLPFELLGKELTFTVDLSEVPAGMNAAVYVSWWIDETSLDGGLRSCCRSCSCSSCCDCS